MLLIRSSYGLRLMVVLILGVALLMFMAAPAIAQTDQEAEQDTESGNTDQSGTVTNTGDNANQCVGVQPVSNTGNAITALDLIIQFPDGSQETKRRDAKREDQFVLDLIDELDLDMDDVGSTIELDPEQSVECAQAVDQAATASDSSDYWSQYWSDYYYDYWGDYYYAY